MDGWREAARGGAFCAGLIALVGGGAIVVMWEAAALGWWAAATIPVTAFLLFTVLIRLLDWSTEP